MARPLPLVPFAFALALATLVPARPALALIETRWTEPMQQWQPIPVARDIGDPRLDLLNLQTDPGPHPRFHYEWVRSEDGVVRASTAEVLDTTPTTLGALSLFSPPRLPDLFVWMDGIRGTELVCYTAPGPGGPGPGYTNRAPAWRITVSPAGGAMPPLYFVNVEGGGDIDIVIHFPQDALKIYDKNGSLLQSIDLSQATGGDRFTTYDVSFADLDGDGRDEILVTHPDNGPSGVSVSVLGTNEPVSVAPPTTGIGPALALAPLSPNPMRARSLVSWTLPQAGHASVRVFDAAGRGVRTLMEGSAPAGTYSQAWDGRDDDGRRLSPGVYMVEVAAGGLRQSRKAVMLR